MNTEDIIREVAKSSSINFGTDAPFFIGPIKIEKTGFADIPIIYCMVTTPAPTSTMVNIVRSVIYRWLESHGIPSECIELTPGVQMGARRKFTDQNPSSASHGKNKFGIERRMAFDIKRPKTKPNAFMDYFEWDSRYGKIPSRRES